MKIGDNIKNKRCCLRRGTVTNLRTIEGINFVYINDSKYPEGPSNDWFVDPKCKFEQSSQVLEAWLQNQTSVVKLSLSKFIKS